jgi:CRISPR system Cascade subunit CasE
VTTWLSRITPAEHRPDVTADLAEATRLHRRIMTLFPPNLGDHARAQAGILFRTDEDTTGTSILVQSRIEPDPKHLPEGYGHAQIRTLDPLLDALRPGLPLRYRITANATRKLGRNTHDGKPLTVIPLHGPDAEAWWARKATEAGLDLRIVTAVSLETAQGTRRPDTGSQTQFIRHARTRFDGTATITDPDHLRDALTNGIGRGKSYGCGLLTIAPA